MDYKIKLDAYEGPLDLLIDLIEKEEVDIYDIPINKITKQYLAYIYDMEELNLEIASEFLIMAATLLQIKSKMLLPKEKKIVEGEEVEIDPREELVKRILAYKQFKLAAEELKELGNLELKAYYKPMEDLTEFMDYKVDIERLDLASLTKALKKIMEARNLEQEDISAGEIRREEYSIVECTETIMEKIQIEERFKFSSLLSPNTNKQEIISFFLSMLELIRLGYIEALQDKSGSDILILGLNMEES